MRHLVYAHQSMRSVISVVTAAVWRWVAGLFKVPLRKGRPFPPWRRLLLILAVVFTLVIEAVMLWMLSELVELCIALMEVWTELAAKHLEITLDRTS